MEENSETDHEPPGCKSVEWLGIESSGGLL
jgi:hypothetical protein